MQKIWICFFFYFLNGSVIAQKKDLVFATYTYSTNNRLASLTPLTEWLSKESGLNIRAVSYPTVQGLINAIVHDSIDFAMMNTSGYLVLQRNNPGMAKPMLNLTLGNDSSTLYGGCLIALKSFDIKSIDDLKNRQGVSLALVNSSSTSGNLVPRLLLNETSIVSPEKQFNVYYAGTHKKVVEDVLWGKANIGGCGCAEIDSAKLNLQFDQKAIVIGHFSNIPLGPVVRSHTVSPELAEKISLLMKTLHHQQPAIFRNFCNGWTEFKEAKNFKPVTDSDYDLFRAMFGNNESLWKLIE